MGKLVVSSLLLVATAVKLIKASARSGEREISRNVPPTNSLARGDNGGRCETPRRSLCAEIGTEDY
jgi:hypothetical protein